MDQNRAQAQVELIRSMMERSGQYSNFSAVSAFVAVTAVVGGWVLCDHLQLDFTQKGAYAVNWILDIWGGVFAVSFAGLIIGCVLKARRNGDRFWSRLAQQVFLSILPGLFAAP